MCHILKEKPCIAMLQNLCPGCGSSLVTSITRPSLMTIHPSFNFSNFWVESTLADLGREEGYTLDKLPVHHRANTQTSNHSHTHSHVRTIQSCQLTYACIWTVVGDDLYPTFLSTVAFGQMYNQTSTAVRPKGLYLPILKVNGSVLLA